MDNICLGFQLLAVVIALAGVNRGIVTTNGYLLRIAQSLESREKK